MNNTRAIPTCRQFRLLICGSRKATPVMLATAYKAVERAQANGWAVLVGDNPYGVDRAVVQACLATGIHFLCIGVSEKPRNTDAPQEHYRRFVSQLPRDYTMRDRYLADLADRTLCIWNGESRGTIAVHTYQQQHDRPSDLLTFQLAA